jgi:O2-independent ubiquinone biosynthesis accessory factor UbiT
MQPFTLPKPLGTLFSILPQYPHSYALAQALNLTLADTLRAEALQPLHGKHICLRVNDANVVFNFSLDKRGITANRAGRIADLTISANAYDFIQLALRKEDPDTLFFSRRLLMEGDTELGLLLKNTLDALELPPLDWHMLLPSHVLNGLKRKILHE